MFTETPPLVASTARPSLEQALKLKLTRRVALAGRMGELEPLAVRVGLIQNALRPRLRQPQLLVFAGDHGVALDVATAGARHSASVVDDILNGRVPLPVFAHQQGLTLNIVDCGLSAPVRVRPGLMARKIAHGTRNCRVTQAMTLDQLHAAIRAGMEIADALPGNVLGCAALGLGSVEAAALVIARITGLALRTILNAGEKMPSMALEHLMVVLQAAQARHSQVEDPVEVLAAYGGFETAMMVGAMLKAAEKRHLILVDGITACAALIVASHIAGPVADYCVFCRSTDHAGLDTVLAGFHSTALLTLGMDSLDGTGIALSWPLVAAAAALLSDVADTAEPVTLTEDVGEPGDGTPSQRDVLSVPSR
jgi:nicotinate-nucleotide--dimethylbenzimidazole phosphoribosyltransferase